MLLNYLLLFPREKTAQSESIDWMAVFVSLCAALMAHQSIPHYPLVVSFDVKDDITTQQFSSLKRVQDNLLGVLVPCFRHNVGQCSSLQVLHDNPQLLLHQSWLKHLHHVTVLIVPHDDHLQCKKFMFKRGIFKNYLVQLQYRQLLWPCGSCYVCSNHFSHSGLWSIH